MQKSLALGNQITIPHEAISEHYDRLSPSFEELAMPLFDSLYNFANWLTRNREDAEDLVQETFIKALKAFRSFQPGTNFRAWMYRILRNTFLTSRVTLRSKMTIPLDQDENGAEITAPSDTPEMIIIERSNLQQIQRAIEELPTHFRETLLLRDVEEMSYREIANILSLPIGTVMSRLARARKALRFALASGSAPTHFIQAGR